jgi:vacuolar-type H+-ATPase subunit F/Vma7
MPEGSEAPGASRSGAVLKVVAVTREDMARGFSLTGLDVIPVRDASAAVEVVRQLIDSRESGLIILEEGLLQEMEERTRESLLERNIPLVVPVPGELAWRDVEQLPPDEYLAELIRHAVGYQLNVQL